MSYSTSVKQELCSLEVDKESLKAELYGFLRLKAEVTIKGNKIGFSVQMSQLFLVRHISKTIKLLYNQNVEIMTKENKNLNKNVLYYIKINDAFYILKDLCLIDEQYNLLEEFPSFSFDGILRGMFLAKGSINQPQTLGYHFEVTCREEDINYLIENFKTYNIKASTTTRRSNNIVYVKKGESIGDCLKLMGAINTMFDFENIRITRDYNNSINRIVNCDIANANKSVLVANRQMQQIEFIKKHTALESLSTRLLEAIILRTKHKEATLQELSDYSEEEIGRYISKSGISHCFKDIENLYNTLIKK